MIISRGIIYNWCVSDGSVDMLDNARKISSNYIKSYQIWAGILKAKSPGVIILIAISLAIN